MCIFSHCFGHKSMYKTGKKTTSKNDQWYRKQTVGDKWRVMQDLKKYHGHFLEKKSPKEPNNFPNMRSKWWHEWDVLFIMVHK